MKKYIVLTDETNRPDVLSALFEAGFKNPRGPSFDHGIMILSVNFYCPGVIGRGSWTHTYDDDSVVILSVDEVIKNAYSLDGAVPKWKQTLPEGYRLVTPRESVFKAATGMLCFNPSSSRKEWEKADGIIGMVISEILEYMVAVPEGYVFDEEKYVTIACEGKEVQISRDSAKALNLVS